MSAVVENKAERAQRLRQYEERYKGQDRKGIVDLYDEWCDNYDDDLKSVDHQARFIVSEKLTKAYQGDRGTATILDVAAGSGLLSEALMEKGFQLLDGLDCCQKMLDIAESKNLYKKYFCNFMEDVDDIIKNDTYDIVVSLAGIGPGHLEASSVRQMFRTTKPGGLICISGVKERWDGNPEYHERMTSLIKELEQSKKVKMIEDSTIEQYYFFQHWHKGIFILMQKL